MLSDTSHTDIGPTDTIRIQDIALTIRLGSGSCWPAKQPHEGTLQPVHVTLSLMHDVKEAAETDNLSHSINYSDLAKELRGSIRDEPVFASLEEFSLHTYDALLQKDSLLDKHRGKVSELGICVVQLRPPLHCARVGVESAATFNEDTWTITRVRHFVDELTCHAIIGVNPAERLEKQDVVSSISIDSGKDGLRKEQLIDFRTIARTLYKEISTSSFFTIEALASLVAHKTLLTIKPVLPIHKVTVKAAKPSALVFAKYPEVEISRTMRDYQDLTTSTIQKPLSSEVPETTTTNGMHTVAIALGSNLGDRFRNIELALRLLEIPQQLLSSNEQGEVRGQEDSPLELTATVSVVNTSFLYETAPMYVTDQPSFINCACLVETNLPPTTLLRLLKKIELTVGRAPSIRFGPRAVDLDLVLYDQQVLDTRPPEDRATLDNLEGELVIPHPRLVEREFVLRPLNDMIPDYTHPVHHKSLRSLLNSLKIPPNEPQMHKVIPFPRLPLSTGTTSPYKCIPPVPETLTYWTYPATSHPPAFTHTDFHSKLNVHHPKRKSTYLMSTLNATPDSFSDGSTHNTLPNALSYARESVSAGAAIIDIGGCSTRPGAAFVGVQEEIDRVVPIVQSIRLAASTDGGSAEESEKLRHILISVDTFRWEVAEAAVRAGANCINDVYAFTGPDYFLEVEGEDAVRRAEEYMEGMKRVAREYATPCVLMHSRGEAGQNKGYKAMYGYAGPRGAVVEGVRVELGQKVDEVVRGRGGVRRWLVVTDPGVGFSKTVEGNLEVMRDAKGMVEDVLVGQGDKKYRNPLAGYPFLIGTSRKSYIGGILAQGPGGRETVPTERVWATAAGVACAVQQGALAVRVHDTREMADVVRMADALWG